MINTITRFNDELMGTYDMCVLNNDFIPKLINELKKDNKNHYLWNDSNLEDIPPNDDAIVLNSTCKIFSLSLLK